MATSTTHFARQAAEDRLAQAIAREGADDVSARVASVLGVHMAAADLPRDAEADALFRRAAAVVAEHGGMLSGDAAALG